MSKRHGFSLLELSVALGIIALIAGFGLSLGDSMMKSADRVNVQERLATIRMALETYVTVNGYLPCPMNRALTPAASATFGDESRTFGTTTCTVSAPGLVKSGSVYIGGVPVRALGLPDNYAADVWGNKFTYAVTVGLVGSAVGFATNDPQITLRTGDRTGTNYAVTSATNRATIPSTSAAISAGAGAAYVVVSHGPDGKGAFPLNGTTVTTACATGNENDRENCDDANITFYDTAYNNGSNAAQYFDDYVVWGSNALARPVINTTFDGCDVGVCEPWCAQCSGSLPNLPSGAPANMTGPVQLCRKIITSTTACTATCVWAGVITATSEVVPCP